MKIVKALPIIVFASLCLIFLQHVLPELVAAEEDLDHLIEGFEDESANASEESFDRILDGFEEQREEESLQVDDDEDSTRRDEHQNRVTGMSFNGHARLRSTYNYAHEKPEPNETDWRGLSSLRSEVMLEIDKKLGKNWSARISASAAYDAAYDINGRDSYTDDVQDNYIEEVELLETYVQGRLLKSLDVKAGRQIVVYGESQESDHCL